MCLWSVNMYAEKDIITLNEWMCICEYTVVIIIQYSLTTEIGIKDNLGIAFLVDSLVIVCFTFE